MAYKISEIERIVPDFPRPFRYQALPLLFRGYPSPGIAVVIAIRTARNCVVPLHAG
jgi:hypothetical protein